MGDVETGVMHDLGKLGIEKPFSTLHFIAIRLAKVLDNPSADDKTISTTALQLRLTMDAIAKSPTKSVDSVTTLQNSVADKLL